MHRAFIGLGSNVGDRSDNLQRAVSALAAANAIDVTAVSSAYDTDPVGPPQPNFLNAVVEVSTSLGALEVLDELESIERELGRMPGERWGPREIDLDLLLYDEDIIDNPRLRVPHPELPSRAFVLVPLAEIAPDVRVPGHGTAADLAGRIDSTGVRFAGRLRSDA